MVLNAAMQMLREADELKQKILKFKSGTSMLQDRSLWVTQQQLQKIYQKLLVLDLDYALDKKVEQELWNVGFKQQIEALQAISKDRKNPLRSEGQAMLSWVLQAATGFYLCLLHQICTTFKLDLPFRRRASLLGWVEGWGAAEVMPAGEAGAAAGAVAVAGARLPAPAAARYICQHCLVHLGDLARYKQQLRVAHTFYRHALVLSAHSGQPYNQLALVAWRRGRRLAALYWHVRSLLVRAPFPPAPANLARTLHAAAASTASSASSREPRALPVLGGARARSPPPSPAPAPARLDAHSYISELIRALHFIHTNEHLDTAATIVNTLNSSLTALIATDSFESMTLIKMACVVMWAVHSTTEGLTLSASALSASEAAAAALSHALAAGALLGLLLPSPAPLAPLRVWLWWVASHPSVVSEPAWVQRPALWPAVAQLLTRLHAAPPPATQLYTYESVPLPEDEELLGFQPLEEMWRDLRFPSHAAWDFYGGRLPDHENDQSPAEVMSVCLSNEPELEQRVRAYRILQLGRRLADCRPDLLTYTEDEEGKLSFSAVAADGDHLWRARAELCAAGGGGEGGAAAAGGGGEGGAAAEPDHDSEDEPPPPPPPIIISEADFREKVREKRVGILKPQGSLERAREERALASTQDDPEPDFSEEGSKSEDKKETRKARVNIAMAAIMRKQEETNKQVKFVTPPPTPESTTDSTEAKDDKPKVIQPKAIKSLANLPIGRKTGGILSLKDKSAGYPHLVNTDPEPAKKNDKEEKKDSKSSQPSQSSQQKRQEPPSPNWSSNQPPQLYNEPRMNFQKNYGINTTGISYNPNYQSNVNNQGIRLPVVNPKEIDVRTAAMQKQNSRQELFQDGQKFGNHNYQMSGDKKNFLNDLPPRFANQYRYWQNAQENQFNENKFRDENFKPNSLFNNQQPNSWSNLPGADYQQQTWWKPDNPPPNFNTNFSTPPLNMQPNFYSPQLSSNMSSPYHSIPSFNPSQNIGQNKPDNLVNPNYLQSAVGQPQVRNLVPSANFNSPLSGFGSYPAVSYDSSMYPQFNNKLAYQPMNKPQAYLGSNEMVDMNIGFGSNIADRQQMNFNESLNSDIGGMKNLEQMGGTSSSVGSANTAPGPGPGPGVALGAGPGAPPGAASTYSLFSGAPGAGWTSAQRHPQQSLWSGPGPSPLERLLEQQKQMKQPPAPQ
ncbi:nonsense-mediated mRNA decay factor SMG7-like [Achroia grisella]|uniref:nonsense-mediated mRNA decay factor SMG7-like n=1 Tax=Achroia grisella TaxID=688607 RepID=UPI0027D2B066|nr:nonsense-mediated mRNA decay factor SMG7-like [Achroia grisella]